jgi:hypothetical protein
MAWRGQAVVENPLVPVDFPNVMGVDYIEETEEFLERLQRLVDVPPPGVELLLDPDVRGVGVPRESR